MRPATKALLFLALLLLAGTTAYLVFHEYVRAATFIARAAGLDGAVAEVAAWQTSAVEEIAVTVPTRHGPVPGRWYSAPDPEHEPMLLVPGVHAAGIDEPRLVGFARDLASIRHPVLTVELPDLKQYAVTPDSTDVIEDAGVWLAGHRDLSPSGRVGLMGISFAGGLSIVAAGRERLRDRTAFVMSFGGHGDLPRTLRYLSSGQLPEGADYPPHDYGVAIILLGTAHLVVPAEQVQPLRQAIRTFLAASHLDMIDRERAQAEFARARELARQLPEPASTLMAHVNERDVERLGPILLPHLTELGGDPALSPSRAPPPSAPVYLLHGAGDNVIPAVESVLLARELRARGVTVHQLTTDLITHAEVDRPPSAGEIWELVRFWGRLLDE